MLWLAETGGAQLAKAAAQLAGKGAVEVLLVHDGAPAAPERAAPPPAQGPALPGSSHAAPAGMAPAYAVAAPGAPGGAALLAPGSPPPQAPLRVVGYAPLPAGDLAAYLSPRAAPAPPARREWRHAPVRRTAPVVKARS
jgi:hypothetical protein